MTLRYVTTCLAVVCLTSCGGGGSNAPQTPTAPTQPTPQTPATFTLSGRVTESSPSSFINIQGAVITFADGSNSGKSGTSDGNGNYSITGLQRGGFSVNVAAPGYAPTAFGVDIQGNVTRNVTMDPSGPRTAFGPGQFRVGSTIAPGRYFSDPPTTGCYWERQSGFGGTFNEIIANDFVSYNPSQYIVDILGSDYGFEGDSECGNWFSTPRQPAQSSIPPGVWLVGSQIQPGTYQVNGGAGCYWERLRNFQHTLGSIIANEFSSAARSQLVTISAGDTGFSNDGDCGTWTRVAGVAEDQGDVSARSIAENRARYEAKAGPR